MKLTHTGAGPTRRAWTDEPGWPADWQPYRAARARRLEQTARQLAAHAGRTHDTLRREIRHLRAQRAAAARNAADAAEISAAIDTAIAAYAGPEP